MSIKWALVKIDDCCPEEVYEELDEWSDEQIQKATQNATEKYQYCMSHQDNWNEVNDLLDILQEFLPEPMRQALYV